MCNEYEHQIAWKQYCDLMQALELGIPTQQTEIDLPHASSARISDVAPVMRTTGNVVELVPMRWSFPPGRPGAKPVFNFRSENRTFLKEQRVLIPASAFFEFVGTKTPKSKYRFTLNQAPFMAIAGIFRPARPDQQETFTMLTTDPGPDIHPYHNRQIVILRPEQWTTWLYGDHPDDELLRPLPAGSLAVELVRKGKDEPDLSLFS